MSVQTIRLNTSGATQAGAVSRIRLVSQSVTGPVDVTNTVALAAHIDDTTDAHDASAISFSPVGTIAATDAQAAIAEVATDAAADATTKANAAQAASQPLDSDLTAVATLSTTLAASMGVTSVIAPLAPAGSEPIVGGLALYPRRGPDGSATQTSGRLHLTFWTAAASFTASKVRAHTRGTAVGGATLVRWGLWTVDDAGAGTLVASTPNDTALFTGTFAEYVEDLSTPYDVVLGQRYASGWLIVATTPGVFYGPAATITVSMNSARLPRLYGDLSSLSNLPASFTNAGLSTNTSAPPATLLLTSAAT